jgi:roadblock/LC7 domain-containing protein
MTTVEGLLKLDGVVAVGEFKPDGSLVDYKSVGNMSAEVAAMSAQFCATVSMLFGTMSGAFSQLSGMSWSPPRGWMFAGGDFTVAVAGDRGVFVETAKADFNLLFRALVGLGQEVGP